MSELEIFLRIAFFGLGFIIFLLTFASLIETRELKIALASVGFAVFTVEGAILMGGIFLEALENLVTPAFLVGVNFIALVFFYLSIIKR